jgi:hypothetical protein
LHNSPFADIGQVMFTVEATVVTYMYQIHGWKGTYISQLNLPAILKHVLQVLEFKILC